MPAMCTAEDDRVSAARIAPSQRFTGSGVRSSGPDMSDQFTVSRVSERKYLSRRS